MKDAMTMMPSHFHAVICLVMFMMTVLSASDFKGWVCESPQATSMSVTPKEVVMTVIGSYRFDSSVSCAMKGLKPGKHLFSATVSAPQGCWAYLSVKVFKNGKEQRRYVSSHNRRGRCTLRTAFELKEGETPRALLRTQNTPQCLNRKAIFSDFNVKPHLKETKATSPLDVIPGYTVASIYVNGLKATTAEHFSGQVSFRPKNASQWLPALPLVFIHEEARAASSILNLKEDQEYQLKLELDDRGVKTVHELDFKTKGTPPEVVETLTLGPHNWKGFLDLQNNHPRGYLRVVAEPGFVLRADPDQEYAITLDSTQRIMLDGLTIRGGRRFAIAILGSQGIIVRNCDIAAFGKPGRQDLLHRGIFRNEHGQTINNDAGIGIMDSADILVERNFIHDPLGTANSWIHSHPAGPNAIFAGRTTQATIRFNDCIGGDGHRWNDAIEGWGNGYVNGSLCKDAEIYGNFLAFGNDDGIELDGGQQNCRFFLNKCEGFLCGISTAPCLVGPSYIYRNLFCELADQVYLKNTAIKNNFGNRETRARGLIHLFNNTAHTGGGAVSSLAFPHDRLPRIRRIIARNNLFHTSDLWQEGLFTKFNVDFDYSLFGLTSPDMIQRAKQVQQTHRQEQHLVLAIPSFQDEEAHDFHLNPHSPGRGMGTPVPTVTAAENISIGAFPANPQEPFPPYRPLPFRTSHSKLTFDLNADHPNLAKTIRLRSDDHSQNGPTELTMTLTREAQPYLTITPAKATLMPGQELELKVAVKPHLLPHARIHHTAFIVRTQYGLSRPVSVYIDNSGDGEKLREDRKGALHATIRQQGKEAELTFQVTQEGNFFLSARFAQRPRRISWKQPGGRFQRALLMGPRLRRGSWSFVANNNYSGTFTPAVHLKPGKHVYTLRSETGRELPDLLDAALVTWPAFSLAPWQP